RVPPQNNGKRQIDAVEADDWDIGLAIDYVPQADGTTKEFILTGSRQLTSAPFVNAAGQLLAKDHITVVTDVAQADTSSTNVFSIARVDENGNIGSEFGTLGKGGHELIDMHYRPMAGNPNVF